MEKKEFLGIYREVAATAIQNWYLWSMSPEEGEREARRIASTESVSEMEESKEHGVWGKSSITAAIESLVKHLGSSKSAEELVSAIYEERDEEVAEGLQTVKNSININRLIVNVLRDVHDQWCIDNAKKFFAEGRNKQFQHLPLELIGWKEAKLDLVFLRPIFQKLGIEIDEKALEEEYKQAQGEFLKAHGLISKEAVKEYVAGGEYLEGLAKSLPEGHGKKEVLERSVEALREGGEVVVDKAGTKATAVEATMAQFEAKKISHPFGLKLKDIAKAININKAEKEEE